MMTDPPADDGTPPELPVMGWREWVALPGLGIRHIKAKVDTGARSSALHVIHLERFLHQDAAWLRFEVHPQQRRTDATVPVEVPLLEERWVRSTSGHQELRPVILTEVRWKGVSWPIELTLAKRDYMGFRMLLGRQAIRGRFQVDPGRSYCGGRPPRKER